MAPPDAYPILKAADELEISASGRRTRRQPPRPDEWLSRLGTLPLMHQPGERWMYNTGSDVLGVLIARARGQPLEAFLRERIFAPLGHEGHRASACRRRSSTGWRPRYWPNSPDRRARQSTTTPRTATGAARRPSRPAAAGLVSTVDDYLAFGQMLLNKGKHGGERILSRPSVEAMTTDHLTPEQKAASGLLPGACDSRGWGFGVSVVTRRDESRPSPGQYGWDGGLGTLVGPDPPRTWSRS